MRTGDDLMDSQQTIDSDSLPRRPRAHVLEDLSRRHVESILPDEWVCRVEHQDYGIDMRVEMVAGEAVTGLEFSIQLKATDRLKVNKGDVVHRCKVSAANYYLARPEPVIYLVYDAQEEVAYWLWIKPYLEALGEGRPAWRGQKTVGIRIPLTNRFEHSVIPGIAEVVYAWNRREVPEVDWDSSYVPAAPQVGAPDKPSELASRPSDLGLPALDIPALRARIQRLDAVEIQSLCLDYFPKVYDKFGPSPRRDEMINLLLDHCRRNPEEAAQLAELLS
jgi:hypothetical protein